MKKSLYAGISVVSTALLMSLVACGDDSSSGTDSKTVTPDVEVQTFDDLGPCAKTAEGTVGFVKDDNTTYTCQSGEWVKDGGKDSGKDDSKDSGKSGDSDNPSNDNGGKTPSGDDIGSSNSSNDNGGKTPSGDDIGSSNSSGSNTTKAVDPCNVNGTDNCKYSTFNDSRDDHEYKTVTIGEQEWFAENLNFEPKDEDGKSYCRDDEPENCDKYGRLYTWTAASVACPEGWHLPSDKEVRTLLASIGGDNIFAGKKLRATTGWDEEDNGTNSYGFNGIAVGDRIAYGKTVVYSDDMAKYWTSTKYGDEEAYFFNLTESDVVMNTDEISDDLANSVRCLKD